MWIEEAKSSLQAYLLANHNLHCDVSIGFDEWGKHRLHVYLTPEDADMWKKIPNLFNGYNVHTLFCVHVLDTVPEFV